MDWVTSGGSSNGTKDNIFVDNVTIASAEIKYGVKEDWQTYSDIVKEASNNLDGNGWDIFVDDTHADHKLSNNSVSKIINDINNYKK